jgi:Tfp pilus assembly protein PilN
LADCNFLTERAVRPERGRRRHLRKALGTIAICLGGAAVLLPIYRAEQKQAILTQRIAEARQATDETQRLRAEIGSFDEAARFLVTRKRATPPVSVILNEVAGVLPDDTWLMELQIALPTVQLSGASRSSSSLIGALEGSGFFQGTEFRSATMRDTRTGRENFAIGTRVRTEDVR